VGLIARAVEAAGIPTVAISLARDLTEAVGVPRALFVKWPLGRPLGEADNAAQQRAVIYAALHLLLTADAPGVIAEPGWRWRREHYQEPDWGKLSG
jgi:D-proline reductase (dithiol) PrdB